MIKNSLLVLVSQLHNPIIARMVAKRRHPTMRQLFSWAPQLWLLSSVVSYCQGFSFPAVATTTRTLFQSTTATATATASTDTREITFSNFWIATDANWTLCEAPNEAISPNFTSKSGSSYYDLGHGIVRTSDHWTGQHGVYRIVDCQWRLNQEHIKGQNVSAYCSYEGFGKVLFRGRKTMKQRGIVLVPRRESKRELIMTTPGNIDFTNFWRGTLATFTTCDVPDRDPDYKSKSGSVYWDEGDSVIRCSDHWSEQHGVIKIVDCHWTIDQPFKKRQPVSARCSYDDFVRRKKTETKNKRVGWRKLSH